MELVVDGEGMLVAVDAEDYVVAGEIDFHHYVFGGHFFEQFVGASLVHYVDAVADALGVALFDG